MIKSRLQVRRNTLSVTVKEKTLTSGQYVESTVTGLADLEPTYEQRNATEENNADSGGMVNVLDVFWFEPLRTTCELPAIQEDHVLVDSDSVRYEVIEVSNEGGGGNRLKVSCRRLRGDT